jgi:hypothetical protein
MKYAVRASRSRAVLLGACVLSLLAIGTAPLASAGDASGKKSIRSFVSCNGTSDDTSGTMKAFAAAAKAAFTLVVDCPVRLKSGIAADRGIFIDNGTTVEFTGAGQFIVDNVFHPAFVIADSHNINLVDWNVVWDGVMPITGSSGGYQLDGKFVAGSAGQKGEPAAVFNDQVLTRWLAANRGVKFDNTQGWIKSIWIGAADISAVFFITGDSSEVDFKGLRMTVPPGAGGERFIPMAVAFSPNWKSNEAVNGKTPHSTPFADIPSKVSFTNVYFDGTLMGWQGNVRDAVFDNVQSHRYGDLQDAGNGNSGGIGKWFPPPHLFYLNYADQGDPGLFNSNIRISNVTDSGPRVGVARDKGGSDSVSGYANSLKLGCVHCSVDHYATNRPDGFMDVLPSEDLTVSNVTATFDSGFLNNTFPGLRFPAKGYTRVKFENVVLTDLADSPGKAPIGDVPYPTNNGITFKNVKVVLNRWSGTQPPAPKVGGANNDVAIDYTIQQKNTTLRLGSDGRWDSAASR